uniref:Alpha-1,4-N-acetylglucosaminyltransferase n=1 Tax=Plectus sambesii TaxID=2011161 RepID=A0A914VZ43_9BILA
MASSHPDRTVMVHVRKELPDMHLWSSLDNVIICLINDSTVCTDTPAEQFYSKFIHELMPKSKFGAVELSDILRVCIVYRLGGTYVDTDVIQLASFNESIEDFVLNQYGRAVNTLFHFTSKGN